MKPLENNYAFIDSQNLNLGVRSLGWRVDLRKFRHYLSEKYQVTKAYLFIGYTHENRSMYTMFQEAGFICVFKPTLIDKEGRMKGNCDAELVLQAMIEYPNFSKAVIVTGDGDFYCLVRYFIRQKKLLKVLVPNQNRYSSLLRHLPSEYLAFVSSLREKLTYVKRTP